METGLVVLSIVLGLVALAAILALLWRGGSASAAPLDALQRGLGEQLSRQATDAAERLERVRGQLQQELSDRIRDGLDAVRTGVEARLDSGRREQATNLTETVARLESKFDALSERQSADQTQARVEITTTLGSTTKAVEDKLGAATRSLEDKFVALENKTTGSLDGIREKVDARLGQIAEQVQKKLDENIKEGFSHFEKVREHLKAAEEQLKDVSKLGTSINDLNNLLKLPHLRGKFGEASLERLLADFLPASMYELQTAAVDGVRSRPDAIIKFPDRTLPIDSKFPREQVLHLFESSDPAQLAEARVQLARVIKEQARSIHAYIDPEAGTADVALLYLPSETLWFEVVQNHELTDYLSEQRVFPVSPNTLLLALHSISLTYRWYQVAKGFERTREEIGFAQKHFRNFQSKFDELGKGLRKAQDAYGVATSHLGYYQSRIARLTGEALLDEAETDTPLLDQTPPAVETPSVAPR